MAYFGPVHPHLMYELRLWGSCSKYKFEGVFRSQKKAVRIISKLKSRNSCRDAFRELGLLTLPCLYILDVAVFCRFKCEFVRGRDVYQYGTRGRDNLRLHPHRTAAFKQKRVTADPGALDYFNEPVAEIHHRSSQNLLQRPQEKPPKFDRSTHKSAINVVNADMEDVIDQMRMDPAVAFSHTISKDFDHPRHMSGGVAVIFRRKFGRPRYSDYVDEKLTCQRRVFYQLIEDFKKKGLKTLVCSPTGCVRDLVQPEHFTKRIMEFQQQTKAVVYIISYNQESTRELRRGLSHSVFLEKLGELLASQSESVEQVIAAPCEEEQTVADTTLPTSVSPVTPQQPNLKITPQSSSTPLLPCPFFLTSPVIGPSTSQTDDPQITSQPPVITCSLNTLPLNSSQIILTAPR
ncbi:hypothetical protein J6590_021703 [Homalodisca vitripennis]|nr:hypothetical protein J6590_021703 [Homalodisca vitripennis]